MHNNILTQIQAGFVAVCGQNLHCRKLLAVSGGADSMALLQACARLHTDGWLGEIVVAHLNHGLRGDAGRADRKFVESQAAVRDLVCVTESIKAHQLENDTGGSLESAARGARYEFLTRVAEQQQCRFVVTAHHRSDQAETVLHNIMRGTGVRGLSGMPATRKLSDQVTCIRPMLRIKKPAIDEFVAEQGIAFRSDATNADPRFLRNRIRQQLLPMLLSDYNRNATDHLTELAENAGDILACVDALASEILTQAVLESDTNIIRLDRRALCDAPEPLLRHAMTLLWSRQEWPRQKMSAEHWRRLADMIRSNESASASLPGRIQVSVKCQLVRLAKD
jgi:tRNA(Ile)-lysidine synthase